ncbi:MAG TPA: Xaa-Pro peptidase family protein [Patescibacteria group bacterium]|nr:Xaa-Pro peptidase family protein [Patescibacteria group bacterium]
MALDLGGRAPEDLEFSLAEYGTRYAVAAALMRQLDLDAIVLAQPTTIRYFTGLQTWLWILPPLLPAVAILPVDPAKATLITTAMEKGGVDETSWIPAPTFYGAEDAIDTVIAALKKRGLDRGRLGFELGLGQRPNLSPHDHQRLLAGLPDAHIVDIAMPLWGMRALKSAAEITKLREAVRLSEIGFQAAMDALRPGATESELTRIAGQAMLAAGAKPSTVPMTLIFLAGPQRYRQVVQPAGDRPINPGEQVWLDGGCSVDGYRADFIRSAVIGRMTDRSERYYDVAVQALDAAVKALGPGRKLGESWTAAQGCFDKEGVGAYTLIPDQIGHSVGLDHWELPLIGRPGSEQGEVVARPGMVLCVEPTIVGMDGDSDWTSGIFCAEDQVVITDSGVEVLTSQIPRTLVRR